MGHDEPRCQDDFGLKEEVSHDAIVDVGINDVRIIDGMSNDLVLSISECAGR
jgi:hypothetical protein